MHHHVFECSICILYMRLVTYTLIFSQCIFQLVKTTKLSVYLILNIDLLL